MRLKGKGVVSFQIKHNQTRATAGKKQVMVMLDKQNPGLGICVLQLPNSPN